MDTMNLSNFEEYFDEKILARGRDYCKSGCIFSLEYDGEEWLAEVEGSEDYTVTVSLSENGEILDTTCDCPYDWDEYCKHQAAVLYALRNKPQMGDLMANATKKEKLEDVLKKLDKQELISIVLDFAGRDRSLKEELFLRYAEKADPLSSARSVIHSTIDAVKRRGYVEYRDTGKAVSGAYTVLEMIDGKISSGDIFTALRLSIVVMEEMMKLMEYCDDSNGTVGGVICQAMERVKTVIVTAAPNTQDNGEIFDIIFSHALDAMYDGWVHWRIDLLSAILPLCANRTNLDKIEQYLNAQTGGVCRKYGLEQLQEFQYKVIRQFYDEKAADEYLEQHLENSSFRRIVIEKTIKHQQYDKALKFCLDGESKDGRYAGLIRDWKEFRYEIYEKTGEIANQKMLALELLLGGDFEYFIKLKALYKEYEWSAELQIIVEKLRAGRDPVYVKVLICEKLKSRLLEYCREKIYSITSCYKHLLPEFENEVGTIFVEYILKSAASANDRGQYHSVCELVSHYKDACGDEAAYAIRDNLRETYARCPAFLDELKRV